MRISDWSSDVCSSDLFAAVRSRDFSLRRISFASGEKDIGCAWSRSRAIRWIVAWFSLGRSSLNANMTRFIPILTGRSIVTPKHSRMRERTEARSEEHTSELQSLMRISYAVFCLKKKTQHIKYRQNH